jgi:CheY-like chemotaxis protein
VAKILVVDDSALTRLCVARLLERAGYTATTASNGKDAWMMLYAGLPDLIVLDLMMPQMDGLAFLRLLRHNHHWNDLPVVILTGHDNEEKMIAQARALGVSDIIAKGSSSMEKLMARVSELVSLQKIEMKPTRRVARGRELIGAGR